MFATVFGIHALLTRPEDAVPRRGGRPTNTGDVLTRLSCVLAPGASVLRKERRPPSLAVTSSIRLRVRKPVGWENEPEPELETVPCLVSRRGLARLGKRCVRRHAFRLQTSGTRAKAARQAASE